MTIPRLRRPVQAVVLATAALGLSACNEGVECVDPTDPACSAVDAGIDALGDAAGDDTAADPTTGDETSPDTTPDTAADAGSDTPVPTEDDQDGDGIPDDDEGTGDTDGDGTPDYLDTDSDGDGVDDVVEGGGDTDLDGTPDRLDDDSDGDTLPDTLEGGEDPDGDGLPNSADIDSDGDGIDDAIELDADTDGDGTLDRYDLDSDNDAIPDLFEGATDRDEDTLLNFRDTDADGDGHDDLAEYGAAPGTGATPADSDRDGTDDFLDTDSDGDGLGDEVELGCAESTDRTRPDSDGDGISDVLEVAFALDDDDLGQACDATRNIEDDVDFYFELPYLDIAGEQQDLMEFLVRVRAADIVFNMDTTGSMGGEIAALRTSLSTSIIPAAATQLDDPAYAVSQFDDFPCSGHGDGADRPLILRQRVTTSVTSAQLGVSLIEQHSGGDYFESGLESIFQICTGVGRDEECIGGPEVPPFDPAVGSVPDEADGDLGGVGFRDGSLPVIVHITDAPSHAKGEVGYAYGASRSEAFAAMRSIGARLVGVASGTDARTDLEQGALRTGSVVAPCAWTDPLTSARPAGCAPGTCCTGTGGAGRPPATGGMCPLVYDIAGSGTGLDSSVVSGIEALANHATFDLTTRVRPDPEELAETGIDTSRLVTRIVPVEAIAPESACASEPTLGDRNRDGVNDYFFGVSPGTQLLFDVFVYNSTVEPQPYPQVFTAYIDVVQQGGAVLDTQIVTVLVPPVFKP